MRKSCLIVFSVLAVLAYPLFAADGLPEPRPPVEVTGTHGKFDFIKVDAVRHRLLACHTGNGTLDVIDIGNPEKPRLIKSVPTGAAQGVAVDDKHGRYFVSVSKPPQLLVVDGDKLEIIGKVPLPGPADLCAYSPRLNRVFVDNDEKPETWVIDPDKKEIIHSWTWIGSGMEDLAFNADGTVFIQNVKDTSELMVVDYAADPSLAQDGPMNAANPTRPVSTLPAEKPHGLAMIGDNRVLIAGGTGKLAFLDYKAGKVTASCNIAPRVDEIAYDPGSGFAYCASGTGVMTVVNVPAESAQGDVTTAPGTHSVAVEPKTHDVWIAYAKGDKSYVQSFWRPKY